MEYIIDVGANAGEFMLDIAKRNPDVGVIGIEPEPTLYNNIMYKIRSLGLKNALLHKVAISSKPGTKKFNVANHGDMGVSSLLEFNSVDKQDYFKYRLDLYYDNTINVEVNTLESVLDEYKIDKIPFIKIDIQGLDLVALQSAGHYLDRIQAGVMEVPTCKLTSMYKDENQTLYSAMDFLYKNGFEVYAVKPNDNGCCEVNVYFIKAGLDYKEIEEKYRLTGIDMYDGNNFWFFSSNKMTPNVRKIIQFIRSRIGYWRRTVLKRK